MTIISTAASSARWATLDARRPGLDVKRIPVCLSSHAAVDVVVELIAAHGVRSEEILAIRCDVPPIVIANLIHDRPQTPQQAQFSMPFAIAAAVLHDGPRLQDLEAARLAQADMIARSWPGSACAVARNGRTRRGSSRPEGAEVCIELE
jgi:2-methylcitrate dehydratase PrpD